MNDDAEVVSLDTNKFLNREMMRINLLLSSLYLSAYEILKATVIEGVKNVLVCLPKPDVKAILSLEALLPADAFHATYDANISSYDKLIEQYKKEVGIPLEARDRKGLIPSCNWLKKEGILTDQDIENVRLIREHRNRVAHELPSLLIHKGFDVDLVHLENIVQILKKVEPFFARIDADIPADVPDESIMSGGGLVLAMIWNTVTEHLQELSREN